MSDLPPIIQKVQMDTTDYKTGAAEINRQIRVIDSGFKANAAAMGDWSKNSQGLELRIKSLNSLIELQQKKVAATTREYERLAKEKGDNSKAAQDMQIKVNKETEALNKLQAELGQTTTAMQKMETKTGGLRGQFDGLKGNLQELGTQVPALGTAFSLLTNPITLAGAGLGAFIKLTSDSVASFVNYNSEILKLTQLTGLGADEISRIVQVADDVGISMETAGSALEAMNKKGITPSIDTLAQLADQYVSATDKSLFLEEATKKYGKSFGDLVPILVNGGSALKDAAAGIDANLVATEESVNKVKEYKKALDDLNDSLEGLKYQLAEQVIPPTTNFVNWLNKENSTTTRVIDLQKKLSQARKDGLLTNKEFSAAIKELNSNREDTASTEWLLARLYGEENGKEKDFIQTTIDMTDATEEQKRALEEQNKALYGYEDALEGTRVYQTDVTEGFYEQKAAEEAAKKATDDLKVATDQYKGSVDRLVNDAFSKYTDNLGKLTVMQAAYDLAMGKITKAQYDQIVQQAPYLTNLQELNKLFDDGKITFDYYMQAVRDGKVTQDELYAALVATGMSAKDAQDYIDKLGEAIDNLHDKEVTITIKRDLIDIGKPYVPDQATPPGTVKQPQDFATGGVTVFTKPTLIRVAEGGVPETVIVVPKGKTIADVPGGKGFAGSAAAGQVMGGSQQIGPIIIQGVPENEMDMRRLAMYVVDEIQRRAS